MSKDNKKIAFELFVQDLKKCYEELDHYVQFFNFYDEEQYMVEQSMIVLKELIETLKDVGSLEEAKKHVKLKKLVKKYNLE